MARTFWRIAADTPEYTADDMTGEGAKRTGGRWNAKGTPMVYASESEALACLETIVHLGKSLPLNRYLVRIEVSDAAVSKAAVFDPDSNVGWDAQPEGAVSIRWGTTWVRSRASLLAFVPSVIVLEASNALINPEHPDAAAIRVSKVRRWLYDSRLGL